MRAKYQNAPLARGFSGLFVVLAAIRIQFRDAMSDPRFIADLARFGPEGTERSPFSLRKSQSYCRRLARRHYENFTVASWLLPRRLQRHFYNIYAYCRWADDLADEAGTPSQCLALLNWWERQLRDCYQGRATHPVFIALAETIREFQIPAEPFADLLVAFRQDQQVARYKTQDQLLDYCRYSANPVGRLVLYLGRCDEPAQTMLADSICTGLQLANFWQDVALDWQRGRVYLPQTRCQHYGYNAAMFANRTCNEAFRRLLEAEVAEAEGFLRRGQPLVAILPPELQFDVALFIHGGLAILDAIRRARYDVWSARPRLTKWEKVKLAARCWWRWRRGTLVKETR
jgi:squalene synthase HpnC